MKKPIRSRLSYALIVLCCGIGSIGTSPKRVFAQHDDILIGITDGQLSVKNSVYSSDIRGFDVNGDGTAWRTGNPGYASESLGQLRNGDPILFDITSPLFYWDGHGWDVTGGDEYLAETRTIVPGQNVTVTSDSGFQAGFLIQRADNLGGIHEHLAFELGTLSGGQPAVGAYAIQQVLRSPQYATSDPFVIVFNNGLEIGTFVDAIRDARAMLVPEPHSLCVMYIMAMGIAGSTVSRTRRRKTRISMSDLASRSPGGCEQRQEGGNTNALSSVKEV